VETSDKCEVEVGALVDEVEVGAFADTGDIDVMNGSEVVTVIAGVLLVMCKRLVRELPLFSGCGVFGLFGAWWITVASSMFWEKIDELSDRL